jgi:hypothetical protein
MGLTALTAMLRWAGVVVGAVVAVLAARSGGLGTGLLLAAPLFGLCVLIGVLAGELTVRAPRGATRTAAVEVRRIGDYAPRPLGWAVAAAAGALVVLVAVTAAAGSADDLGRPGRALVRQCTATSFESHGPWPGRFYAGPLAIVVLAGSLLTLVVMRAIARRPRSGADGDDAQRRRSARTVTGAAGVLVAIPLAGVSLTAAVGLLGIACAPLWWKVAGWALLMLVAASLVLVGWCLAAAFVPAGRAR